MFSVQHFIAFVMKFYFNITHFYSFLFVSVVIFIQELTTEVQISQSVSETELTTHVQFILHKNFRHGHVLLPTVNLPLPVTVSVFQPQQ